MREKVQGREQLLAVVDWSKSAPYPPHQGPLQTGQT